MFRISVRFRLGLEFGWFRVSGVIFFVLVSADPLPAVSAFPCSREGFRDLLSLILGGPCSPQPGSNLHLRYYVRSPRH